MDYENKRLIDKVKKLEDIINNLTLNLEMWLDGYHFDEEHKIKQKELINKASDLIGKPKTIEELCEILEKEKGLIIKDALVGFVILKYLSEDGITFSAEPLNICWDGIDDNDEISKEAEVIGVISAPPNSFRILGLFPNDTYEFLGYEFSGAYKPDWKEELEYRIKVRENND